MPCQFNVKMLPLNYFVRLRFISVDVDCEHNNSLGHIHTAKRLSFFFSLVAMLLSILPKNKKENRPVCRFVMNESDTKCYSKPHNLLNALFPPNFTVDLHSSPFGRCMLKICHYDDIRNHNHFESYKVHENTINIITKVLYIQRFKSSSFNTKRGRINELSVSSYIRQPKALCLFNSSFISAHFLPLIIRIIHPRKSYKFEELM